MVGGSYWYKYGGAEVCGSMVYIVVNQGFLFPCMQKIPLIILSELKLCVFTSLFRLIKKLLDGGGEES